MAVIYPELENIQRLKVPPTPGEWDLVTYLKDNLDDSYEVFFNPYLDGDRPDIIILKERCGAFIIEVKDWNLTKYRVLENNKWDVFDGSKWSSKASPHTQVFRYKKDLYDLHLPIVGLASLKNPNFFNFVHCLVYFYNSDKKAIDSLYSSAEEKQREERGKLNQRFKENEIDCDAYDKAIAYQDKKRRAIQRDKSMSFGSDRLALMAKKIKEIPTHNLFDGDVYRDFKRRLSPSQHTLNQGIPINFDPKQLGLTKSKNGGEKIQGVAGCGKTSILSQRAINAHVRHGSTVLILTFNITLKNYIRDTISDIQGHRNFSAFEISTYHQFYNSQVNNAEMDIVELIERYGIEQLYSVDIFQHTDVAKYHTILLDEVQDYQSEWVKIVRDNFLSQDGEMVLFSDDSQNIYKRDVGRLPVIAHGFGSWNMLTRSYRTSLDSPLNLLFKDFQTQFLIKKYADTATVYTKPTQLGFGFSLLKYESIPDGGWGEAVFDSIQSYMKSYEFNPNDVVILCSKIYLIRHLNEFWIKRENTQCMFETYQELSAWTKKPVDELKQLDEDQINLLIHQNKDDIYRIRRAKKNHFYANSGLIKLSTIHSYKGLGSKVVFYVMCKEDEPEVVYTSITRSSEHLVVFDLGGKSACSGFLSQHIK